MKRMLGFIFQLGMIPLTKEINIPNLFYFMDLIKKKILGLSNKGSGGRIKCFMDRGMASGKTKKFILVTVTGVLSKKWG